MQCELRAKDEISEGAMSTRISDTLPKRGRVNEVCKEWLVYEDGALAYRLQKEEVEQHYTGNKSRNAIVREDFPRAVDEQKREHEEALERYHHMIQEQEEDAHVAKELAKRIQREEVEKLRRLEIEDKKLAEQIQEKEKQNTLPDKCSVPPGDVNSVGLPNPDEIEDFRISQQFRNLNMREASPISSDLNWPPPPQPEQLLPLSSYDYDRMEEEYRRMQEQKDEELARLLQQQEEGLADIDQLDKDRLMAIEAQDKELARMLQERERAKAKRARERAKQKALLRKQQQQMKELVSPDEIAEEYPTQSENDDVHTTPSRPTNLDVNGVKSSPSHSKPRYPDPEEIEVLSSGSSASSTNTLPNIAMAIDPTYTAARCTGSNVTSPAISLPPPNFDEEDDGPVPPYMPIQGQRRTASLEKKSKKSKVKDGCKQQ